VHSELLTDGSRSIPTPSDEVLIQLAGIAAYADEVLAPEHRKEPVGLTRIKNDRRRAMESILVRLADPAVRNYVAEMERLGLIGPV
jgi:hypothetical protein